MLQGLLDGLRARAAGSRHTGMATVAMDWGGAWESS